MFGSLTAAYEFRNRTWLVSPYGRFELSRSWLDGFTENGGGIYGLTYGDQTVDTAAGVIGLRLSYTMLMDWGALTPGVRAEYTHDFASSSRLRLGYSDIGTLPYELEAEELGDDYSSLGLSLDAALLNNWAVGVEYRAAVGSGRQDHAVGIRVRSEF
jgi:outer membrane autotransporter protein